jgi:predicted DNA-binding transcriptional regulator YafY
MRADRLVATLLLLQARGTVTASEVAAELEVSERTARRDLDALGVAGIPVYSKQGRGGGWQLIGGARTDLTGFRSAEARALLTMAAATGQATPEFTSAMRKLTQALPEPIRVETEQVMASVVADSTSWGNRDASLLVEPRRDEWLEPLQQAVIDQQTVVLTYDTPRKGVSQRDIDPLGLVVKQGYWYLLAMTVVGQRSFRVDRIVGLEPTDRRFDRPPDFDLAAAWESITISYIEKSTRVVASAVVDDQIIPALRALGVETVVHGAAGTGRSSVTIGAWNAEVLAAEIAGVMHAIDLVDPPAELTSRLAAIGRQLVSRFVGAAER